MKRPSWNSYFMSMAYLLAERSHDRSSHVGAVIVGPNNEIRSTGFNGFPRGIDDDAPGRSERPEKYFWTEHAERNAIYNAARHGTPLNSCIIYITALTCMDCARAIINSGIKKVIVDKRKGTLSNKWNADFERVEQLLKEAGVEIVYYVGPLISRIRKFVDGQEYNLD
ncbi:CMP deaminase [archaeon]|jgi:dCMP deaminase|nr:CMP deaminase [archaeon]